MAASANASAGYVGSGSTMNPLVSAVTSLLNIGWGALQFCQKYARARRYLDRSGVGGGLSCFGLTPFGAAPTYDLWELSVPLDVM